VQAVVIVIGLFADEAGIAMPAADCDTAVSAGPVASGQISVP
jgi:hypothetical protein